MFNFGKKKTNKATVVKVPRNDTALFVLDSTKSLPATEAVITAVEKAVLNDPVLNAHGAVLANHNRDLVKRLNDLKSKRAVLEAAIEAEEHEKLKNQEHLQGLEKKLEDLAETTQRQARTKAEVERVITSSQGAYDHLVQTTQSLVGRLDRNVRHVHNKEIGVTEEDVI